MTARMLVPQLEAWARAQFRTSAQARSVQLIGAASLSYRTSAAQAPYRRTPKRMK